MMECRTGPRKDGTSGMSRAKMHPQMEPVTVRFTPEAMRSIEQIARRHGMSKAQVVRLATDSELVDYLQTVRIVSPDDAAEIQAGIRELCEETRKSTYELHKIGVNVNQIAKAVNIASKEGHILPEDLSYILSLKLDLSIILARYEGASEKVGEALCRILA